MNLALRVEHQNSLRPEQAPIFYDLCKNIIDDAYHEAGYFDGPNSELGELSDYASTTAAKVIERWANPAEKIQAYVAYIAQEPIGFILFAEKRIGASIKIYIAEFGVAERSRGVGAILIKKVLNHYSVGTEFCAVTRVFNQRAKSFYLKNGANHMSAFEVEALGYDPGVYCGFKLNK